VFGAVRVHSVKEFSFAGERIQVQAERPRSKSSNNPLRELSAVLQREIYASCYCRRFRGRFTHLKDGALHSQDIIENLSCANLGKGRWEAGWTIAKAEASGLVWAQRQGQMQWFWPGQYVIDRAETAPFVGASVNVYLSKEDVNVQPGFYLALSESIPEELDQGALIRLYWNVSADGVLALIGSLTERLNRFHIPFRFKCPRDQSYFDRRDAAVFYIARRFFPLTMRLVSEFYARAKPFLNADTPLFSKILAPGLGLAEDPGTGESFGLNRSRLLSESICIAYGKDLQTQKARFEELTALFHRHRLDLSRPYLSPDSKDDYDLMPINAEIP
jgi:HopA1 effector protein family